MQVNAQDGEKATARDPIGGSDRWSAERVREEIGRFMSDLGLAASETRAFASFLMNPGGTYPTPQLIRKYRAADNTLPPGKHFVLLMVERRRQFDVLQAQGVTPNEIMARHRRVFQATPKGHLLNGLDPEEVEPLLRSCDACGRTMVARTANNRYCHRPDCRGARRRQGRNPRSSCRAQETRSCGVCNGSL